MKIKDSFLITQNVDNLHQDSGVDEERFLNFMEMLLMLNVLTVTKDMN